MMEECRTHVIQMAEQRENASALLVIPKLKRSTNNQHEMSKHEQLWMWHTC